MASTRKPLTPAQIQQLWVREGGSRDWATTMAQIAGRESSGKYWVNNAGLNKNGTVDHGLFQINDIWRSDPVIQRIGWQNRYDPVANTKMAVRVFQAQGPKAWATYQGHVANVPTTGGIPGGAPRATRAAQATGRTTGGTTTTRTTTTPGVDNSQLRRSLIADFLGSGGVKSTQATQQLAAGWLGAQDVPGTSSTATTRTPGQAAADVAASHSPLVADASSGRGGGGAHAALGWAQSKVGFHETGTNSGGLASYLNQRFGMSNQPWCAMFTSAAVTKGGAPAIARTASVAEVRRQAMQGGGGYQKGFVNPARAKGGDLITFGDDHIAMVKRVSNGRVYYVGGNQSDGVTESSVPVGHGDIVRPLYGARHRA